MGIRFRCHQCGHDLHVKDFQGGKRSKCPECETKFRIPAESAEYSIPLGNSQRDDSASAASSQGPSGGTATGTIAAKLSPAKSNTRPIEQHPIEQDVDPQNDAPQEIDSVIEPATASSAQPRAILEAPGATWYVRPPAGGQYGPAPADIFCEWLTENRVTRDSLVWRDGWPEWLVAGEVFTDYFGPALPPTSAPTFATSRAIAVAPAISMAPAIGVPSPQLASPSEQTPASEFVVPTSLSDRALAARKRQRKKNYVIMIGVLAAISIGLVIALVVVLMRSA